MSEPLNEAVGSFCIRRVEETERIRQWLVNKLEAYHYGGHDTFAIRLAFEEAACNAITHGNDNDPSKRVTVDLVVSEAKVEMTICDEGPGFDHAHLKDPTASDNILRDGGRGVLLIHAFMDEIHYKDAGNCVHLVKYRSAA